MKATEAKLLSFLQKSPQFIIPIYQRTYSWTDKQCRQLWDDIYQPANAPEISGYTIDDHPYLIAPGLREVFEAFRKEVLALDPCVTEEFLKGYVAYRAESDFVGVKPRVKSMRLYLNMPFAEINDPKGLCKDYVGKAHAGIGDVRVLLKSIDELPYIMGLVRQSYEHQMGNGDKA